MSTGQAKMKRARSVVVFACLFGTVLMFSITRRWLDAAFFSFFLLLGLFTLVGHIGTRRDLSFWQANLNVGFWILIFAAAVSQLWVPGAAVVAVILWYARFVCVALWPILVKRRHVTD